MLSAASGHLLQRSGPKPLDRFARYVLGRRLEGQALKKPSKPKTSTKRRFDSFLGLTIADSWETLGEQIGRVRDDKGKFDKGELAKWAAAVVSENDDDLTNIVTPESLQRFVETTLRLLETKAKSRAIGAAAKRLVRRRRFQAIKINEEPGSPYLDLFEPGSLFWAVEYQFLFEGLGTPADANDRGWLQAVGYCDECGAFFVKARGGQRFHSNLCRTKFIAKGGLKPTAKKRGH